MKVTPSDSNISSIVQQIEQNIIDLQPDFQREIVWKVEKQQKLIDSLIRHWHIPPIHLVQIEGKEIYEVLDGKQRLFSIYQFYKDGFPFNGNFLPDAADFLELDKKKFSQFPQKIRNDFLYNTQIRFLYLTDVQSNEATELFLRLNYGTTVSASEKRNCIYGPIKNFLRQSIHEFPVLFSVATLGFPNYRMVYQDLLDKIFYLELKGNLENKPTSTSLEKMYFVQDIDDKVRTRFINTLENVEKIMSNFNEKFGFKLTKSVFISYYWFLREAIQKNHNDFDKLKKFLIKFEEWRKEQQKRIETDKSVNVKYIEFETFLSEGWLDPSSLSGRHKILTGFYQEFLRSGKFGE